MDDKKKKDLAEQFSNTIMNNVLIGCQYKEIDKRKTKATLETFNKHGVSTEKAMKILGEIGSLHAEIDSEYDYECEE